MIARHVRHFFAAFGYSVAGIKAAAKSETAFQQEILTLVLVFLLSFFLFPLHWCLGLTAAWLFVMALELLNMAVESVADLVTRDIHPLVKRAKDAASAAVFIAICANAGLWLAALWSRFAA